MMRPVCHREKQATDAARCGPGAGVRPHERMDSCAAYISQKDLLLSALTSQSAPLWPYGHVQIPRWRESQTTQTVACYCAYIARRVFKENTVGLFGFTVLLLKPYFHLSQTAVWTWHGTSYASTSVCLQRQRHVPQFITNGRLCTPFMHERVCMP